MYHVFVFVCWYSGKQRGQDENVEGKTFLGHVSQRLVGKGAPFNRSFIGISKMPYINKPT